MFNNPYFNNYREMPQPQQPIQNIINTQMPLNNLFMAQYLKDNEKVEDIFVNHKTAFIDLKNKQLKIKEVNGDITTYEILLPKDEKDIKIEMLEQQIKDLKEMFNNESNANVPTNNEVAEQDDYDRKPIKTKSSIK